MVARDYADLGVRTMPGSVKQILAGKLNAPAQLAVGSSREIDTRTPYGPDEVRFIHQIFGFA